MMKVTVDISLTLEGPLLSQSSAPGDMGLDMVAARDKKGRFSLPGTLVSGKLRQAWEELNDAATGQDIWFRPDIDQWLGKPSEYGLPESKRLVLSDFALQEEENPTRKTGCRDRIKIDRKRGAVDPHQLVMIEAPFISGEEYVFRGQLHFFSPSDKDADAIIDHIRAGFNWFSQVGALRSTGFGHVIKTKISSPQKKRLSPPKSPVPAPVKIPLAIKPLQPFCLPGNTLAYNVFESGAIIPGGAILGCLATTWKHLTGGGNNAGEINDPDREELKQNFNKLRITHGFSGQNGKRPVVAPLSLVRVEENKKYFDVALLDGPHLINGKPPDFSVDWKDEESTLKDYPWPYIRMQRWGWVSMESELRIRTAINRNALRSEEKRLFAYEQIIPDDRQWYAELDLSRIDERERGPVFAQLQSLVEQGLIGLGKTKAMVEIQFPDEIPSYVTVDDTHPLDGDQWVITLQSDTLLGSPEHLHENSTSHALEYMYSQAWQEISGGTLALVRYFTRQKLSGGRHRYKLFQAPGEYRPWLLTEAGSAFVLRTDNDTDLATAKQNIELWLQQGLPLGKATCDYYGLGSSPADHWRHTPFTPQNGYGEIGVNICGPKVKTLPDSGVNIRPIAQILPHNGKEG